MSFEQFKNRQEASIRVHPDIFSVNDQLLPTALFFGDADTSYTQPDFVRVLDRLCKLCCIHFTAPFEDFVFPSGISEQLVRNGNANSGFVLEQSSLSLFGPEG